jgi:pilus assembly protein CpaB
MKNARVFLILALAIICGLAAGYAALRYLNDRPTQVVSSNDGETVPVVLAGRDLPLGTVLDDEDLTIVEWPAAAVPLGFASSKEEVSGRSLIANVRTNEPILPTKLADSGLLGIEALIPGTGNMRAMSVRVSNEINVTGFVTPGTFVDVILIMTPSGGSEPISQTILQNVQAIASGTVIQESETGEAIQVNTVTVLVSQEDAEKLSLAEHEGDLRMTLRNRGDVMTVDTRGVRRSALFSGAGSRLARPQASFGATAPIAQESFLEVYQGGVLVKRIRY